MYSRNVSTRAIRPKRQPDVILPESDKVCMVEVWVKENVFCYKHQTRQSIETAKGLFRDAIKYLEYSAEHFAGTKRGEVALSALAEQGLLDGYL